MSPNSDENEISLYIITACSNIQVMGIKETITKDETSWYLDKFSLLVPYEMYGERQGEYDGNEFQFKTMWPTCLSFQIKYVQAKLIVARSFWKNAFDIVPLMVKKRFV